MGHTNAYPYQEVFEAYLHRQELAQPTIVEYRSVLTDLFSFLSNFNVGYQADHRVATLLDRDVEQYLAMLVNQRQVTNGTYNKMLSHINIYFKYLFTHDLITHYPTLTLKGKSHDDLKAPTTKWLHLMPSILANQQLAVYTRLTLLLSSHFYTISEFLTPGFNQQLDIQNFKTHEQAFWQEYQRFIEPLQERQHSRDLFLKQRLDGDPHLTAAGLHKYLKPDEKLLGFSLTPTRLYQSAILDFLLQHPRLTDQQLSEKLRLDPQSLNYYRQLAMQYRG
ncbi:site-specific integrase [Lactobacillus sp. LC28-10]|uniref:Site-specific integrase n=1 Tax=Secundilactobacillus angelensis TaxID=2722706 RepID=A0ABX1KXS1_9LACO|nr:winged helix-turn-helix domain-containing protein [Secundilactobacillus angelensis]MCH5462876.1 winged helix-turn-helix domain-containing protein [Secundilactobacillus angelensis]NLR18746.1 site-specific integrase [Secundilactobacillus angelensis]